MSFNRRDFLKAITAGSAVVGLGCGNAPPPTDEPDAGAQCGQSAPPPLPALDWPLPSYFDQVSQDLDAAGIGTPVVFVDMDRVDANIQTIVSAIPSPLSYRIVEKSLPSLDLLAHLAQQSGSQKFLVLHLPFLGPLLNAFPMGQVLIGKSHLTPAVHRFFTSQPAGTDLAAIARRVIFLADTPTRLNELVSLAQALGVTLKLAIELDVGLRRSGLSDPSELPGMLDVFLGSSAVQFAGFMGYDGHVAFPPAGTEAGMNAAWVSAMQSFRAHLDVLQGVGGSAGKYAALASLPDLVFNSGGSSTFPMYSSSAAAAQGWPSGTTLPVNDVAAGGGVLRPGDYPDTKIHALKPAIFIATPVFRTYSQPQLPFFTPQQNACIFQGLQGLTIYGGGWSSFYTYPNFIRPVPFESDPGDTAMVPNQGMVTAPASTLINPGDWIFYHPRQSDALFQFEQILQIRGGRLQPTSFSAYPTRY